MRNLMLRTIYTLLAIFLLSEGCIADELSDNLILNNIGSYRLSKPHKSYVTGAQTGGPRTDIGPGLLRSVSHFSSDHVDKIYEVDYWVDGLTVEVQVTQHAGGESDRWLLHELEGMHRYDDDDGGHLGMLYTGSVMFVINVIRGIDEKCIWISDNKVVKVDLGNYEGDTFEHPVLKAYLAKHPSSITMTDEEMKSPEHEQQWVKDEIERRLWLNDQWIVAHAVGKVKIGDLVYELYTNEILFLRYTDKYYGRDMKKDVSDVIGYARVTGDVEGLKKKHAEFKAWWASHKDDSSLMKMFRKLIP